MKKITNARSVARTDREIGVRLKEVRLSRNMSQEALAEKANVTFQQIQKYEKGTNRIACSRLLLLSKALKADPTYLLLGATDNNSKPERPFSTQALRLGSLFDSIEHDMAKKQIMDLARAMTGMRPK